MKEKTQRFSSREAVEHELKLEGIVDPNDWREVLDDEHKREESKLVDEKIEHENWQKILDNALKSGNYEAIAIMKRARPNMSPSPALTKKRLNELVATRPENWDGEYCNIRSMSGLASDLDVLEKAFGELLDQCGKVNGADLSLRRFITITYCIASSELVQAKYLSIFSNRVSEGLNEEEIIAKIRQSMSSTPNPLHPVLNVM